VKGSVTQRVNGRATLVMSKNMLEIDQAIGPFSDTFPHAFCTLSVWTSSRVRGSHT
jgi:hypothetical protein